MADDQRLENRNFLIGVINGALFNAGVACLDSNTVIPVFLGHLTDSSVVVGVAASIFPAGLSLTQFFTANTLENQRRKMPSYALAAVLIVFCIFLLSCCVFWLGDQNRSALLWVFMFTYSLYAIASGMGMVPFYDIAAKTIPIHRLGSFMAQRWFWGSVLSVGVGWAVSAVLARPARFPFPSNFALLFLLGAVMIAIALAVFIFGIKEPIGETTARKDSFWKYISSAVKMLSGDPCYSRLVAVRLLAGTSALSLPFLMRYATTVLGLPSQTAGTFLMVQTLSGMLASLLWGRLSDRSSNKICVQLVCIAGALAVAMALMSRLASATSSSRRLCYSLVFAFVGAYSAGLTLSFDNFLVEIAPGARRPTYVGFMNTLVGVETVILPLIGGGIVDSVSYSVVFAVSLVFQALAAALSLGLADPRRSERAKPDNSGCATWSEGVPHGRAH